MENNSILNLGYDTWLGRTTNKYINLTVDANKYTKELLKMALEKGALTDEEELDNLTKTEGYSDIYKELVDISSELIFIEKAIIGARPEDGVHYVVKMKNYATDIIIKDMFGIT